MLSVKLETYYLLHSSPSCSWSAVWLVAAGKHFQWWEMRIEWNKTSLTAYFPTVWVFFCKTLIFCVILVESSFSLPAFTFCILHILHTTFRCRRDTFLSMCLSCTSIFPLSSYLLPSVQFDFLLNFNTRTLSHSLPPLCILISLYFACTAIKFWSHFFFQRCQPSRRHWFNVMKCS